MGCCLDSLEAAGVGAGIFTSVTVEPWLYSDVLHFTRGFGVPQSQDHISQLIFIFKLVRREAIPQEPKLSKSETRETGPSDPQFKQPVFIPGSEGKKIQSSLLWHVRSSLLR